MIQRQNNTKLFTHTNFTTMKLTKAQQNSINKLNKELQEWAEHTGDKVAMLYEDIWTDYTLEKVAVKGDKLTYWYDGRKESEQVFDWDEVKDYLSFWRSCLRRAKRYWETDSDTLDKMSDGEIEDNEE